MTRHTTISEIRPLDFRPGTCRYHVEVVGTRGTATLYRRDYRDAMATAIQWATFLHAPIPEGAWL